jgi:hypothetical protein
VANNRPLSRSLRGVPSGFDGSNRIRAFRPTVRITISELANGDVIANTNVYMFFIRVGL